MKSNDWFSFYFLLEILTLKILICIHLVYKKLLEKLGSWLLELKFTLLNSHVKHAC